MRQQQQQELTEALASFLILPSSSLSGNDNRDWVLEWHHLPLTHSADQGEAKSSEFRLIAATASPPCQKHGGSSNASLPRSLI